MPSILKWKQSARKKMPSSMPRLYFLTYFYVIGVKNVNVGPAFSVCSAALCKPSSATSAYSLSLATGGAVGDNHIFY